MAHLKACNDRLNLAQSLQKKQNKQTNNKILKILDVNSLNDQELWGPPLSRNTFAFSLPES